MLHFLLGLTNWSTSALEPAAFGCMGAGVWATVIIVISSYMWLASPIAAGRKEGIASQTKDNACMHSTAIDVKLNSEAYILCPWRY